MFLQTIALTGAGLMSPKWKLSAQMCGGGGGGMGRGTKVHGLNSLLLVSWLVILNLVGVAPAHGNLVINATFDSSITGDPNAAVIEGTINSVIALYEASFSDPITVEITFQEMTSGLGSSSTAYGNGVPYSTYYTMLAAAATTAADAAALALLPAGSNNPANGSTTMEMTLPNGRALGFSGPLWDIIPGFPDGTVSLNTSIMNLTRASTDPSKFDLFAITAHEIDEVLGLSSALDGLTDGMPPPTGDVDGMDLFRYDESGNRSFNTSMSSLAYFSLDGKTWMVRFNQGPTGDFHDWYPSVDAGPHVQDAFGTPGATPNPTVELIALDVIGYHLLAPAIAIAHAGNGRETVSWSPGTPGYVLQESTNLQSGTWLNSASGTNNPVTITNTSTVKFFRVILP